jgi:1,4-alpha-glucan branching enzyme
MHTGRSGQSRVVTDVTGTRPSARRAIDPSDLYLFNEGRQFQLYDHLGAHVLSEASGARFGVWAPNAQSVSVRHDGNGWTAGVDLLEAQGSSGVWAGTIDAVPVGTRYKYHITPRVGPPRDKADPLAFATEEPPLSASVLTDLSYRWGDEKWMRDRAELQGGETSAISIYEIHLGSWRRNRDGTFMSYSEIAEPLADYVGSRGFSHVELLPIMEHPYYGSWGYQTTGYFAPTARYGSPTEFMALVDHLHQRGIGVLLDWVPSHFATDAFSLGEFDGTHLYEHEDPRHRIHPDWGSYEFNYSRHEVRSLVLARAVSPGRAAGRRRGVDAVPRLLPFGGPVGAEPARRAREHRCRVIPPPVQRIGPRAVPGCRHYCRGIHRLARCVEDGQGGRARFLDEVGHGLDARHADPSAA